MSHNSVYLPKIHWITLKIGISLKHGEQTGGCHKWGGGGGGGEIDKGD